MIFTYQTGQWLPYPINVVFAFFADPGNLPALMPAWQKARVEHASLVAPSPASRHMAGKGSQITLTFRPFPDSPFRLRWLAEIAEFEINSYFIDRQLRGPFHSWDHIHRFRVGSDPTGRIGTFITDRVAYIPPLGFLGRLANSFVLEKQLSRTFAYRHRRAAELLARKLHPSAA